MLTIRKRGRYWHVRGAVRAAGRSLHLKERSTGETDEAAARRWARRKETELENDLRDGRTPESRSLTFALAADRVPELPRGDTRRLLALVEHFGDRMLADLTASDWSAFARALAGGRPKPATVDRYLSIFRAVFRQTEGDSVQMPKIVSPRTAPVRRRATKVRWLTMDEADRLVAAYAPHARPIATVLRFQGLRSQEALQLDRRHVNLGANTLFVDRSKNGLARTMPMHARVRVVLAPLMEGPRPTWLLPNGRDFEPLFLTPRGEPYADTRGDGGNPLKKAHAGACERAGIAGFSPHDWRRHWACWCLRSGMDPWTLMRLGGWSDLKSIAPYVAAAAGDTAHQEAALARTQG
jgi:integrase